MEWFVAFKYLHIVAMVFGVGLAVSGELVVRRIAGSGDSAAIHAAIVRIRPLGNVATAVLVVGVVFGVVAALTGQIDPFAPWLLLAYAGFVAATLVGMTVTDPWVARLEAVSGAAIASGRTDELQSVIDDPLARAGTWTLMALIAFLVFVMVVKPLG